MRLLLSCSLLSLSLLLPACDQTEPYPGNVCTREDRRTIPIWQKPAMDLLIVLDRSPSMADQAAKLAATGASLAAVIETIEGGVPDLHLAVVTSDLGATGVAGCGAGDGGVFQGGARCGVDGAFLEARGLVEGGVGGNFTGELDAALTCLLDAPISTCPVSQPLGAAVRALDGSNASSAGFRRDYAALIVVVITDGDDCTLSNPSALAGVVAPNDLEGAIEFACFARGTRCMPADPSIEGAHTGCTSRGDMGLVDVTALAAQLRGFVSHPSLLFVTTVAGDGDPVMVSAGSRLAGTCATGPAATAAPRLAAIDLPERAFTTDVCGDWIDAFEPVAELVRVPLSLPCGDPSWDLEPATPGAQLNCVNTLVDSDGQELAPLPWCDAPGVDRSQPCIEPIAEDHPWCPDGLGPLTFSLGDERLPDGVYADLRCEVACE